MTHPPEDPLAAGTVYADPAHSAALWDVGGADYAAITGVHADGTTCLVLAHYQTGDADFDATPPEHECCGPLPLEVLARLTAATRRHTADTQPEEETA